MTAAKCYVAEGVTVKIKKRKTTDPTKKSAKITVTAGKIEFNFDKSPPLTVRTKEITTVPKRPKGASNVNLDFVQSPEAVYQYMILSPSDPSQYESLLSTLLHAWDEPSPDALFSNNADDYPVHVHSAPPNATAKQETASGVNPASVRRTGRAAIVCDPEGSAVHSGFKNAFTSKVEKESRKGPVDAMKGLFDEYEVGAPQPKPVHKQPFVAKKKSPAESYSAQARRVDHEYCPVDSTKKEAEFSMGIDGFYGKPAAAQPIIPKKPSILSSGGYGRPSAMNPTRSGLRQSTKDSVDTHRSRLTNPGRPNTLARKGYFQDDENDENGNDELPSEVNMQKSLTSQASVDLFDKTHGRPQSVKNEHYLTANAPFKPHFSSQANRSGTSAAFPQLSKRPIIDYGPYGYKKLRNIGNSCYMNSTLQILAACPIFVNQLRTAFDSLKNPSELFTRLELMMQILSGQTRSKSTATDEAINNMRASIKKLDPIFEEQGGNAQQDAEECLTAVLGAMSDECTGMGLRRRDSLTQNRSINSPRSPIKRPQTPSVSQEGEAAAVAKAACDPVDLMECKMMDVKRCVACNHCYEMESVEHRVHLGIGKKEKKEGEPWTPKYVQQLLDTEVAQEETISDFKCEKCGQTSEAIGTRRFVQFGEYIIIVLKRFHYDYDTLRLQKLFSPVRVPLYLDMTHYIKDGAEEEEEPMNETVDVDIVETTQNETLASLLQKESSKGMEDKKVEGKEGKGDALTAETQEWMENVYKSPIASMSEKLNRSMELKKEEKERGDEEREKKKEERKEEEDVVMVEPAPVAVPVVRVIPPPRTPREEEIEERRVMNSGKRRAREESEGEEEKEEKGEEEKEEEKEKEEEDEISKFVREEKRISKGRRSGRVSGMKKEEEEEEEDEVMIVATTPRRSSTPPTRKRGRGGEREKRESKERKQPEPPSRTKRSKMEKGGPPSPYDFEGDEAEVEVEKSGGTAITPKRKERKPCWFSAEDEKKKRSSEAAAAAAAASSPAAAAADAAPAAAAKDAYAFDDEEDGETSGTAKNSAGRRSNRKLKFTTPLKDSGNGGEKGETDKTPVSRNRKEKVENVRPSSRMDRALEQKGGGLRKMDSSEDEEEIKEGGRMAVKEKEVTRLRISSNDSEIGLMIDEEKEEERGYSQEGGFEKEERESTTMVESMSEDEVVQETPPEEVEKKEEEKEEKEMEEEEEEEEDDIDEDYDPMALIEQDEVYNSIVRKGSVEGEEEGEEEKEKEEIVIPDECAVFDSTANEKSEKEIVKMEEEKKKEDEIEILTPPQDEKENKKESWIKIERRKRKQQGASTDEEEEKKEGEGEEGRKKSDETRQRWNQMCADSDPPPPRNHLLFRPVDKRWMRAKCIEFGFKIKSGDETILNQLRAQSNLCLSSTEPSSSSIVDIEADGNCLFRALAWWVTGNEDEHMKMRKKIVEFMFEFPSEFGARMTGEGEGRKYTREENSRMLDGGEWGTQCEIFGAATMLGIDIYTYHEGSWKTYRPIFEWTRAGGYKATRKREPHERTRYGIYLTNNHNYHYDAVKYMKPVAPRNKHCYKLLATIRHHGETAEKGHYVADVYDQANKKWINCDDSVIKERQIIEVLQDAMQHGYVLVYGKNSSVEKAK